MAIHEHLRWNSYMISQGFVPASKYIIRDEKNESGKNTNGKSYKLRRHGNLTTFKGLEEYRRIVATRDDKKEEESDVIKYDYQLLDDAYWLLENNNYIIVKKK